MSRRSGANLDSEEEGDLRHIVDQPHSSNITTKLSTIKIICIVGVIALTSIALIVLAVRSSSSKGPYSSLIEVAIPTSGTYSVTQLESDDYTINGSAVLKKPSSFELEDNPSIKNMKFKSRLLTPNHVEIRLTDIDRERYEVPHNAPFPVLEPKKAVPWKASPAHLAMPEKAEDPFFFNIKRKATKETVFNSNGTLIYTNHYLEFTSTLPRGYLYGLGERTGPFQLRSGTYTLWNKDSPFTTDNGTAGYQTYGYHPVYLIREESGLFSLVFLRISNAMDVIIDSDKNTITFKIAGGIFDMHVIMGQSDLEDLVKSYHDYIGHWNAPPMWSLGWHQCRWGYKNLDMIKEVLENYETNKIPLDTIWTDIDYMDHYVDFTIDKRSFPIEEFNKVLKYHKKHWVPIIDAGVAITNDSDITNKRAKELDVAIKNSGGKDDLIGSVWPGVVFYVDFWNPLGRQYWAEMLKMLYEMIPFSGIWLDMNELSNFCDGNCDKNAPFAYKSLPYTPGGAPLYQKTLDLGALHEGKLEEFNVHNFGGYMESKATHEYLKSITPMPFILSRSTAYGSGQFANHWTGDNVANTDNLLFSISGILSFNLYGIPMTGSDICGFYQDASEYLCARWHQVGAWYPFARNHHHIEGRRIEPYAYGSDSVVLATAIAALRFRYAHLRHYETQFLVANGSGTIFRPLFFEFPSDDNLFTTNKDYSERQFMIGDALMISPSVREVEVDNIDTYFPKGAWYDYKTGSLVTDYNNQGKSLTIESKLQEPSPVFIRESKIVFAEFSSAKTALRSDDLDNKFTMTVALNRTSSNSYKAKGNIMAASNISDNYIWDNCVMQNCIMEALATGDNEEIKVFFEARDELTITVNKIKILGLNLNSGDPKLRGKKEVTVVLTVEIPGKEISTLKTTLTKEGWVLISDVDILINNETVFKFNFDPIAE